MVIIPLILSFPREKGSLLIPVKRRRWAWGCMEKGKKGKHEYVKIAGVTQSLLEIYM